MLSLGDDASETAVLRPLTWLLFFLNDRFYTCYLDPIPSRTRGGGWATSAFWGNLRRCMCVVVGGIYEGDDAPLATGERTEVLPHTEKHVSEGEG